MRAVFLDYDNGLQRRSRPSASLARAAGSSEYFAMTERSADQRAHRRRGHRAVEQDQIGARATCRPPDAEIDRRWRQPARTTWTLQAARELGIAVCNVRGYCTASVAQHAWAMILSLTQHLTEHARLRPTVRGARRRVDVLAHPHSRAGRPHLGGGGLRGARAAPSRRSAKAFGMRVIIARRARRRASNLRSLAIARGTCANCSQPRTWCRCIAR